MAWDTPQFDPSNTFGNFALRSAQAAAPIGAAFTRGLEFGGQQKRHREQLEFDKPLRDTQIALNQMRVRMMQAELDEAMAQKAITASLREAAATSSRILANAYMNNSFSSLEGRNEVASQLHGLIAQYPPLAELPNVQGMLSTIEQMNKLELNPIRERQLELERERQSNRLELEKERQEGRTEMEELRQQGRSLLRDANGRKISFEEFVARRMDTFLTPRGSRETADSFNHRRAEALREMRSFYDSITAQEESSNAPANPPKLRWDPQRRMLIDSATGEPYQFGP